MNLRRYTVTVAGALGIAAASMAAYAVTAQRKPVEIQPRPAAATMGEGGSVLSANTDKLIAFLKVGRMPDDPATRTGGVMPGFAWMPEDDLRAVAEYLTAN